jgi:phosphopantetheinyl transferase
MLAEAQANPADLADAAPMGLVRGAERLLRRRILRALAARVFRVSPGEVGVARAEDGRPYLTGPTTTFASVGGRDGWAVIGLGPTPIGVDIESGRPKGPLPLDLLHPSERQGLEPLLEPALAEAFARIWVVKEALAKAAGRPLQSVLSEAHARPPNGCHAEIDWNGHTIGAEFRREHDMVIAAVVLARA